MRTSVETALLAISIYIEQAQGGGEKTYKKRSRRARGLSVSLSSLRIFWVGMPSHLEDVFSSEL